MTQRDATTEYVPANRVISVDVMTEGRIRVNYFDNTWEIFDSNPAVEWLVKAFEIERDANTSRLETGLSDRRYTPEELLHVAERTLIPQDMHKRSAILGVIAAFGDPDKIYATPPSKGSKYQAGKP